MKNNVLTNKVTRNAIFFTLAILFVYRLGSFIVTPGIDPSVLESNGSEVGQLASLFDFFGGGSILTMSLFALGVSPYISSSIIIQLLENELVPSMNEWKQQGIEGQNKRTKYTKYLALVLAFIQALVIPISIYINPFTSDVVSSGSFLQVAIIMTAGVAIMIWLADRITEKGIGNGTSVLIMAGIITQIPATLLAAFTSISGAEGSARYVELLQWGLLGIILLIVIIIVIIYSLAYRKVPINYVRTGRGTVRKNSYIPVKLNPAGVIPVIFVQPLFIMLSMLITWMTTNLSLFTKNGSGWIESVLKSLFDTTTTTEYWWLGLVLYFLVIVLFSVFYSYIQMNPENMSNNLERQSAYVIAVRPGEDTEVYLSNVIFRTSLWGGMILALIAILPLLIQQFSTITNVGILGTGLIIVVNVLVQVYNGLVNKIEAKKYGKLFGEV